ncbi:CRISPR-associated protein Cas4 [Sporolituus thermophilus]|uniref:CRISPR-associated exonuclease Cas4 n=1 Tax=Sporolituus thermophilus DSM 23256 TaxID=1123285 RepID=A0A1G7PCY6_9FIRM|nr:CRISPR-associated protein Cas4 [Sporolituus thermophilus]SDF84104.1 CRISPR-associated exonuclease Cas4 [Sporolituus thermophilus DSM 23256]
MVHENLLDDDWLMLSGIQHYSYCPRQFAIIHMEQIFEDNIFTIKGHHIHEKVDIEDDTVCGDGVVVASALPLWSDKLRLIGRADRVEFRNGVPYPVEFKSGYRKEKIHDALQLCAQAMCLEEMTGIPVTVGAIYYYSSRRRLEVVFDNNMREKVTEIVLKMRQLLSKGTLPAPPNDQRCVDCSLIRVCLPELAGHAERFKNLLQELYDRGTA